MFTKLERFYWVVILGIITLGFYLSFPHGIKPFSFDTISYVSLSKFRQPLYGETLLYLQNLGLTELTISRIQLFTHYFVTVFFVFELAKSGRIEKYAAIAVSVFIVIIWKYGALRYGMGSLVFVGKLIPDGYLYSLLLLLFALLIRFLRTNSTLIILFIPLIVVLSGQLKTAAILFLCCLIPFYLIVNRVRPTNKMANFALITLTTIVACGVLPLATGKQAFQLGTEKSRMAFVAAPRIAMLKVPTEIRPQLASYSAVNKCWMDEATNLHPLERSVLNAATQEYLRYDLIPNLIAPTLMNISTEQAAKEWETGENSQAYLALLRNWIEHDQKGYIAATLNQLFALITNATLSTSWQQDRLFTSFTTVNECHQRLGFKPLRFDYPMKLDGVRPKAHINITFIFLRLVGLAFFFVSLISLSRAISAIINKRLPSLFDLTTLLGASLWFSYIILPALLVYAEPRYVFMSLYTICGTVALNLSFVFKNQRTQANIRLK